MPPQEPLLDPAFETMLLAPLIPGGGPRILLPALFHSSDVREVELGQPSLQDDCLFGPDNLLSLKITIKH